MATMNTHDGDDDDRCKRCGEPYANDLSDLCMDCELAASSGPFVDIWTGGPARADCCCHRGAARDDEYPEDPCRDCPVHMDYTSEHRCRRHAAAASDAGGPT